MSGADVYVTGDLYYHVAHDALMLGLNVVDPGHHVEKVMKEGVANVLKTMFTQQNLMSIYTYHKLIRNRLRLYRKEAYSPLFYFW